MAEDSKVKCVIVGAGPVGALSALYAAKRGWDVEVYELRGGKYATIKHLRNVRNSTDASLQTSEMRRQRHSTSPNPSIWPYQFEASKQ